MDFRKVLARIFFPQFVAQTFNIDSTSVQVPKSDMETPAPNENLLLGDGEKKKQELSEGILAG